MAEHQRSFIGAPGVEAELADAEVDLREEIELHVRMKAGIDDGLDVREVAQQVDDVLWVTVSSHARHVERLDA